MATNMVSDAVLDLKWLAEQGAMFALPAGRTKGKFPEGWQNSPHGFDEAVIHGKRGGNVGILTGKHSANIVALDRDISFPETCQLIGDFSLTAKIIRSNAQERGKFLFRVVGGEIPQTVSWKPEGEKHPHAEFLGDNGQRHALGPTSVYNEGYYSLIDKEYGIKEITPSEIDYLWRLITGGSIYKDVREQEQEEAKTPTGGDNKTANDDYLKSVLAYWTTRKVFEHFNKMTNGTKREGSQLRILGNGGLLLGANNEQWSIPGDNIGGGPIQAYTWCKWGKVIKPKGKEFWEIINSMADDAGIAKPVVYLNGNHTPDVKNNPGGNTTDKKKTREASAAPKSTEYLEVLADLGYKFEMNQLDDRIELNGSPLSDGIQAEIRTKMRDLGYNKIPAFEDAYMADAYKRSYHPVKRYLDSLTWHGTDYIGMVADHMESNDMPITYADGHTETVFYAYFKRWMIGSIERALNGKQHPMLVLVAGQGVGKSQFVRWVGSGLPDLYNEGAIKPDNKEHDRLLAIKWIWEVGELGATTKRQDVEALKDFLTRQGVTFRIPWGVNPVTKPALASFIGTVNPSTGFLTDVTGNRRFTIAEVSRIDWRYSTLDANQLWAQAYQLYKDGERSELTPEEAARQVESNKEHLIEDPYEGWINRLCDIDPLQEDWSQTTTELTALLQDQGVRGETRAIQMRLSETLKGIGVKQHANDRPRRWLGIRIKYQFDK